MNSNLKLRVSFAMLSLLILLPLITFAEVPSMPQSAPAINITTPSNTPISIHFEKQFEPNREGEKPRSSLPLGRKLDAYTLTIQNNGPNPIQILSGQILNHLTPEEAYAKAKQSAGLLYAESAGAGLVAAPFTFGLSLALELFILGPIAASHAGNQNEAALNYINQHAGVIPLETILPKESKQYPLITLKDVKPDLHLSVQDLQTHTEWSLP